MVLPLRDGGRVGRRQPLLRARTPGERSGSFFLARRTGRREGGKTKDQRETELPLTRGLPPSRLPAPPPSFPMPRTGPAALAGAPNLGKSSLLNALVGHHLAIVSPRAQATRLPVVGLLTQGDTQFIFHDLPGLLEPSYLMQARMRELALDALRRVDLVLHLHPAPDAPAPPLERVARLDAPIPAPVLTVYTKGDLLSAARREALGPDTIVVAAGRREGLDRLLAR